jgi:hypothetical protein
MLRDQLKPWWALVLLFLASYPLEAQPAGRPARHPNCDHSSVSTDKWFSFQMGDLFLEDMPPAVVRKLGKEPFQGYEFERIELTAPGASFRVAGSVLQGQLTDIYICGLYLRVQGEERPRLKIPPGGLFMTLRSQLPPLEGFYGGQIVLPQQRTWLTNRTEVQFDPTSKAGDIVFEMHPVRLQGLLVELPLVGQVTTNAISRPKPHPSAPTGGPEFVFSLTDNSLQLTDGDFDVDVQPFLKAARGTFGDSTHWLDISTAKAAGALLAFHRGASEFTISNINLTLQAVVNHLEDAVTATGKASFGALKGTAAPDPEHLQLPGAIVTNGSFQETGGVETCDSLVGVDDAKLHSLGLDKVIARRKAAAVLAQSLATSQPQIYATLPLPPLQHAIEAALPAALQKTRFSTCPSEIVAIGGLDTSAPEGTVDFALRIGHQFVLGEVLGASRAIEGATLRAAKVTGKLGVTALPGWLDGRFADAFGQLGPLATITMNAPFTIRPTVSTAAWGGGTLSGTVAKPQTQSLGNYKFFLDTNGAHVLGGLQ